MKRMSAKQWIISALCGCAILTLSGFSGCGDSSDSSDNSTDTPYCSQVSDSSTQCIGQSGSVTTKGEDEHQFSMQRNHEGPYETPN